MSHTRTAQDLIDDRTAAVLRSELLRLAREEDDRAAAEAATVPYWMPRPLTVDGHRVAARLLRDCADSMLFPGGRLATA